MSHRRSHVQVTDEEMTTGLWSRLETLYTTKSVSNKLYLKKQLYGLSMKEGTTVLEHLNLFNKISRELLAVDVKINEEDKSLYFSVRFQSHTITLLPPCSMKKELSS